MAKARMISCSLSISEKRARLHDVAGRLAEFCQQLYPLMVVHADDFGRHAGDPFTVKHEIDPTSRRSLDEFARALQLFHEVGLIVWYEHERRKYYEIVDFEKHQKGLHKRTKSHLPEPPGVSRKLPEVPSERNGTEQKSPQPPSAEGGRSRRKRVNGASPSELENVRKTQEVKRLLTEGVPRAEAMRRAGYQ